MITTLIANAGWLAGPWLPAGLRSSPRKSCVCALLAALIVLAAAIDPAAAESGEFHCGRQDSELRKEPAAVWFEVFRRRSSLADDLRKNGNDDLAARFEVCAMDALRRSAELGDAEAEFRYGLHLSLRKPMTEDARKEAFWWLRKAADHGHEGAKRVLRTWQ